MINIPMDNMSFIIFINLLISLVYGFLIGVERESRGKAAGISTQSFVIGGAMLFTFFSILIEPTAQGRIAAQVVSGIGFLGAGIILISKTGEITNLTTAASIWFSASIGMAIGLGYYMIAFMATLYSVILPRIPHISRFTEKHDK
jgi:putative Mg2+ transporter-C (MgtC) family protein